MEETNEQEYIYCHGINHHIPKQWYEKYRVLGILNERISITTALNLQCLKQQTYQFELLPLLQQVYLAYIVIHKPFSSFFKMKSIICNLQN